MRYFYIEMKSNESSLTAPICCEWTSVFMCTCNILVQVLHKKSGLIWKETILIEFLPVKAYRLILTFLLLNPDIPCLCKQCRSRSVDGFFRSQLIWICTVCQVECECIINLYQVIWLAENQKWAWHLNLFSMTMVNSLLACVIAFCSGLTLVNIQRSCALHLEEENIGSS